MPSSHSVPSFQIYHHFSHDFFLRISYIRHATQSQQRQQLIHLIHDNVTSNIILSPKHRTWFGVKVSKTSVVVLYLLLLFDKEMMNNMSVMEGEMMEVDILFSSDVSLNNETSAMDHHQYESYSSEDDLLPYKNFLYESRFWVQRVLVPIIMVIGIVGNSITIMIMTRRRMRSSTNNYLAALAIFDMLYLIFTFILSLKQYPNITDPKYYYYWQFCPFAHMITDCCSNSSVWLTVTFTIERFIVVSHPIKGKVICTESRSRKVILLVFTFCFMFVIPVPFEWNLVEKFDPITNTTRVGNELSSLGQNELYKTIYYWLTTSLFTFIPLLLLTVFNSFLIRSVHISRKERFQMTQGKGGMTTSSRANGGESSELVSSATVPKSGVDLSSSKQENKITIMLIAVVILFFICQFPTAIMLIIYTMYTPGPNTRNYYVFIGLNNIFNFLMALNSAGNFLLYCLFSQRYRRTFVNLFCPCYKNQLGYFQSTHPTTTQFQSNQQGGNKGTGGFGGSRPATFTSKKSGGNHGITTNPQHDLKVIGSYSRSTSASPSSRSPSTAPIQSSSLNQQQRRTSNPVVHTTDLIVTTDDTDPMSVKTTIR